MGPDRIAIEVAKTHEASIMFQGHQLLLHNLTAVAFWLQKCLALHSVSSNAPKDWPNLDKMR